jgi:hypothetical protein
VTRRIHSLYLDELEEAAVQLVARTNRLSPNAVCRALIRKGLGLPALELQLPEQVQAWAERRRDADAAGDALR